MISFLRRTLSLGDKEAFENTKEKSPPIEECQEVDELDQDTLKNDIYDLIRTIKDPEKPSTLEDLLVVYEDGIKFKSKCKAGDSPRVVIEFNPTVPHCSLATLIGLCIRIKLQRNLPQILKLDILIKKGAHDTEDEINKQINDKERIAAAMENPNLKELVEKCILEEE